MRYISTRGQGGKTGEITSSQAIWKGLAFDGGLFVPESFPEISVSEIAEMPGRAYSDIAMTILQLYLTDYGRDELKGYLTSAYSAENFGSDDCAPVHLLSDGRSSLELWHGPTSAFKDIALQLLPYLLTGAGRKAGGGSEAAILVATSGDTGKAALDGFADVPGTRIIVFYPESGVSQVQQAQMSTQKGSNVSVIAVEGNFDDTQTGVKAIFNDQALADKLKGERIQLSSANSMNFGRLVPQIVYYFSAYAELIRLGRLTAGDPVNFAVPTGNFGNILAGYYAKRMGLPVNRLICASNENNVLTDFFSTGKYDKRRSFKRTSSPSMDILISSNLERLLFELAGRDGGTVRRWMSELMASGCYSIGDMLSSPDGKLFWGGFADEIDTRSTIASVWRDEGYLIDTHTSVAFDVVDKYRRVTGDRTETVIISTASPYKFNAAVAGAILDDKAISGKDEFTISDILAQATGVPVPGNLSGLRDLPILHTAVCKRDEMKAAVEEILIRK